MKIRDLRSDTEVRELVAALETCELPLHEFKHCAHIAVALAYLADTPLEQATERMRLSLRRMLENNGIAGFHETMTVFWMKLLDHLAATRYASLSLCERVNAIVESHGTRWPVEAHYSNAVVASQQAREHWVAPDLLPIPF